jgi:hypothetical protein
LFFLCFVLIIHSFTLHREHKIGEVSINLIEVLRNETTNIADSPTKSSIFSSFSADKRKRFSNQWENSSASNDLHDTGSVLSSLINPSINGFTHTAWYTIPTKTSYFRSPTVRRSSFNAAAAGKPSYSPSPVSSNSNSQKKSSSFSAAAVKGNNNGGSNGSYIYALASKGPREDVDEPQLQITLKVHML